MGEPSNTLTYDQSPARRPGLDDVGGATQENDPEYPPLVGMPTAEMANQAQKLLAAYGAVTPLAIVSVRFNAGTPVMDLYTEVRTTPVQPTLNDLGNGDTSVTWNPYPFPAAIARAVVTLNDDLAMLAPVVLPVTNGFEVKTRNSAGTLADCAFTLTLY